MFEKLKHIERVILEYNLFSEHNNETSFLGFKTSKAPEPKFRNDGSPLKHGDKYYMQDGNDKNLKDDGEYSLIELGFLQKKKR